MIGEFEIVAPETEVPDFNTIYHYPKLYENARFPSLWKGSVFDKQMFDRGMVFLEAEDAEAMERAILLTIKRATAK